MASAILSTDLPGPAPSGNWLSRLLALVVLACALSCLAVGAQQGAPASAMSERSVKAAFLYKFLSYVEFAAEPGPSLVVGVLGSDEIAAELSRITGGRMVGNRNVVVRNLKDGESLAGVHLLFVGADAQNPARAMSAAAQQGTVTVSEQDDGLQQGSVINFRVVDQRVRFEVSLPAAERSNARLSSRLLSVAYHVQKGGD